MGSRNRRINVQTRTHIYIEIRKDIKISTFEMHIEICKRKIFMGQIAQVQMKTYNFDILKMKTYLRFFSQKCRWGITEKNSLNKKIALSKYPRIS